VPHFFVHRSDHETKQKQRIMELKRIFCIHDVYDELFRALASYGRGEEFLSLWQEAEKCLPPVDEYGLISVGARFTWRTYCHLFNCFALDPKLRISEAIEAYDTFQSKLGPNQLRAEAVPTSPSLLY
jgi:hypothetical protein